MIHDSGKDEEEEDEEELSSTPVLKRSKTVVYSTARHPNPGYCLSSGDPIIDSNCGCAFCVGAVSPPTPPPTSPIIRPEFIFKNLFNVPSHIRKPIPQKPIFTKQKVKAFEPTNIIH